MQIWEIVLIIISIAFVGIAAYALYKKPSTVFDNDPSQKNPVEGKRVIFVEDDTDPMNADGVCGHLEIVGESHSSRSFYDRVIKRVLDIILSFLGLLLLSPLFLILCIAVYIDDPGPIFFKQKRVGLNKQYFSLHKFRSMKMSTPHDVPTHMLENPESYITRVGRVLRKLSLDELPQIGDIFIGNKVGTVKTNKTIACLAA